MGQRSGGKVCLDCRHWRPDALAMAPSEGFCLRANIGCLANIATPLHVTHALNVCKDFIARDAQERAGSLGGISEPALVICAGDCA
jgi:hypothetical protein